MEPHLGLAKAPTQEEGEALFSIAGGAGAQFACWNGHEFEVVPGSVTVRDDTILVVWRDSEPSEYQFVLHFPIDPRVRVEDVRGATRAYPNETNDGWLFAHCDEDWHHDHEMRLRAAVDAVFGPAYNNSLDGVIFGMRRVQNDDTTEKRADADRARIHFTLTDKFHKAVVDHVLRWARSKPLGWFHQHPHEAHVHQPVEQAIRAITQAWLLTTGGTADYNLIRKVVEGSLALVTTRHTYETRWAQDARLEAERKAAEAAAEEAETAGDAAPEGSGE